jgi:hypothetical protein
MNNDIRISCSFPEHYKTKKLMAIAGNAAPFSLICLWVYAARNKPDGFLDNMDNFDIEIASNWTGQPNQFFDALVKCKFLTVADEGYYLHDWEIHQPYASSAEERSAKARFSILARHNRDLHTKLKEQGVNGLSVSDYKEYTKRIRPENDSNTKTYKKLTPSPLPYPVPLPAPEPLPFPKDNNNHADFKKSADDELPFADKSGLVQVEKVKPKSKKIKADKIPKESNPNAWAIWVDVNREFGRADPFAIGKDTKAAKSILAQIKDPEKYADILRQFLSDDDKFLMQNGHSISFLTSKINKYLNKQYQPLDTYDFSPEEEAYIYAMEERIAKEEAEKAKQQKE